VHPGSRSSRKISFEHKAVLAVRLQNLWAILC
jgi:hypothetical protein